MDWLDPEWLQGATWESLGIAHCIQWEFDQGASVAEIAERRGVPESAVEWWLKIARLAPPFLRTETAEDRARKERRHTVARAAALARWGKSPVPADERDEP